MRYVNTTEYYSWQHMKDRCYNKRCKDYPYYGARGITVCKEWKNDYRQFLEDMGKKPSPAHSLDRVDNNQSYNPSNCRWATKQEQTRNRRPQNRSKTGVTGVKYVSRLNKYEVTIGLNYKNIYLGVYSSLKEATATRKKAEAEYWN